MRQMKRWLAGLGRTNRAYHSVLFNHHGGPTVLVFDGAVLDATQCVEELLRDGAWLVAEAVAHARVEVVDVADGTDDGSGATGTSLLEGGQLLLGDGAALHLHAQVLGHLHQALVGDAGQDRGRLRRDVGVVLDAEEVGGATLVHVFLLLGIQVELAGVALLMGQVVGEEAGGVVASHLILTRAKRSRAVVVADDDIGVGGEASLEIGSHGRDEDEEAVFLGGMHAHLCAGADEQRADIERGPALVGGNPLLVQAHHLLHHLGEQLGRHLGHHDAPAGTLQASGILVDTEDAHLAIGAAICFQALESLLAVVQTGGCHVQFQILVGADFNLAPFAVAIIATHVVVGLHVAKRQVGPV